MREIKFIDRPEVLNPCSDCREVVVCAKCKSDIAEAVHFIRYCLPGFSDRHILDLFTWPTPKGKNWYGEDGDALE